MDSVVGDRQYQEPLTAIEALRRLVAGALIVLLLGWTAVAQHLGYVPMERDLPLWWDHVGSWPFMLPRVLGVALVALFWYLILRGEDDGGDDGYGLGFLVIGWVVAYLITGALVALSWFGVWVYVAAVLFGAHAHAKSFDAFDRQSLAMYACALASIVGPWSGFQAGIAAGLLFLVSAFLFAVVRRLRGGATDLNHLLHHVS